MSEPSDGLLANLHADWRRLLSKSGADPAEGERVFSELIDAYRGPWRFYHNLDHVCYVLAAVTAQARRARDLAALCFAAWFHDAVYDSRAPDNEERSAAWAERALTGLGVAAATIETVWRLILLTKTHRAEPNDNDGGIFLDADLIILGMPASVYRDYARAIRQEYAWVPDETYCTGRARVLRSFLERDRIYVTAEVHETCEEQARENLRAELHELEAAG
jgi:predicted metal-dependent HD superfamily phosphohydrolase